MISNEFSPLRRRLLFGAAAMPVAALSFPQAFPQAHAADIYPSRPITFICPWPAGGSADLTMRVLAQQVSQALGQPVVFENRAGAAGMIGAKALSAAKPDGYTIGQIPLSVTRFAQLGTISFDPLKDFTYLARTSGQTFGIVVRTESSFKTLADLVAYAKANPGKLNYATSGIAGATHVGTEEFCMAAGIKLNHVPYKGGAPALTDLLGGQVDLLADSSAWAPYVEQGRLRLLVTWGAERPRRFANAPTLKELGYNIVNDAPNGVGAPAGLDPQVAVRLGDALRRAVLSPEFRQACDKIDAAVLYQGAEDYRKFVFDSYARETRLIEKLKLKEQLTS